MAGKIIALDLASKVGIAVGEPGAVPLLWTHPLGRVGGTQDARFAACLRLTGDLIQAHGPGEIVIEKPIHGQRTRAKNARNPDALEAERTNFFLVGLRACVRGVANLHGVPVHDHAVSTVRLHFIGHGMLKREAAKAAVMARCRQLRWAPDGEDSADAAALWDYACSMRSRSHALANQDNGLFASIRGAG